MSKSPLHHEDLARPATAHGRSRQPRWRLGLLLGVVALSALGLWYLGLWRTGEGGLPARKHPKHQSFADVVLKGGVGQYSPQYDIDWGLPLALPKGCEVTMANLLERHAARFPTSNANARIRASVAKLSAAASEINITDPAFEFVRNWTYTLWENELVPLGRKQALESGQRFHTQYSSLASRSREIFIRSSGASRVLESAQLFRLGYRGGKIGDALPDVDVVLPEGPEFNNTLDADSCPLEHNQSIDIGTAISDIYATQWAPRLAAKWNKVFPGADLGDADIIAFFDLCAFETVANDGELSEWCKVFSEDDFAHYAYHQDLVKYYSGSYGHPHGPSRGVGYVNELLARLTSTPVRDESTTNSTLEKNPETFPLPPKEAGVAGHRLFADFSHDTTILTILSALGLARPSSSSSSPSSTTTSSPQPAHLPFLLPPSHPPPTQLWDVSRLTPFAGRIVFEKLHCPRRRDGTEFVRVLVNEGVYPLPWEECGRGGTREGVCELGNFVRSQGWAREGGEWGGCFV